MTTFGINGPEIQNDDDGEFVMVNGERKEVTYLPMTLSGTCSVCGKQTNDMESEHWETHDDYKTYICHECAHPAPPTIVDNGMGNLTESEKEHAMKNVSFVVGMMKQIESAPSKNEIEECDDCVIRNVTSNCVNCARMPMHDKYTGNDKFVRESKPEPMDESWVCLNCQRGCDDETFNKRHLECDIYRSEYGISESQKEGDKFADGRSEFTIS